MHGRNQLLEDKINLLRVKLSSLQICYRHGIFLHIILYCLLSIVWTSCQAFIIKLIDGLQDIFHNHSVNSVSIAFPRMEIYERHQNTNQILRFGPKELQTFKAINSTPGNFFSLFPLEFLVAFAERCIYESCTNIINLGQCGGITELCFKFNNWLSFMKSPWQTTEARKLCFFLLCFTMFPPVWFDFYQ